jgi:hypothetical protein
VRCFNAIVDDAIQRRLGLKEVLRTDHVKVLQAHLPVADVAGLLKHIGDPERLPSIGREWRWLDSSPISSQLEPELV